MKKLLLMILFIVSSSAVLYGQQVNVRGVVFNANSKNPIEMLLYNLKAQIYLQLLMLMESLYSMRPVMQC